MNKQFSYFNTNFKNYIGSHDIEYFRSFCLENRFVNIEINSYNFNEKEEQMLIKSCAYCREKLNFNLYNKNDTEEKCLILFYINTPIIEYFLCKKCGLIDNIPITNSGTNNITCYKYMLKYLP